MTTPRRLRRPEPKRESRMANLSKIVQSITVGREWASLA